MRAYTSWHALHHISDPLPMHLFSIAREKYETFTLLHKDNHMMTLKPNITITRLHRHHR